MSQSREALNACRHTNSGAEAIAKKIRGAQLVSAFNTVPSEVLFPMFEARRKARRPSLVYCGDDEAAKEVIAEGSGPDALTRS